METIAKRPAGTRARAGSRSPEKRTSKTGEPKKTVKKTAVKAASKKVHASKGLRTIAKVAEGEPRRMAVPGAASATTRPTARRSIKRIRATLPEDMKNSTLNLRLREGLKEEAAAVLVEVGISIPEAIRVFLGRVVSEGKFPFELEVPNAVTRRAMEEARQLSGRYTTAGELFDDLGQGRAD